MTAIVIQLLNHFRVTVDAVPITQFRSDKARALVAYVATQPDQIQSRSALATLLWPTIPDASSKANLRSVLSNLRQIVPDALTITRNSVSLNPTVTVDVGMMRNAMAEGDWLSAVAAYTGEFLRGFSLGDAIEFDDWLSLTRESLHISIMQTFDRLHDQLIVEQQWERVIQHARRQLQLEAWHEPAYRALLHALMAQGLVAEARSQYERCRAVMEEEFGVEPSLATQSLWRELNRTDGTVQFAGNLPPLLTPFFGRSREIAHIAQLLTERKRRLITITGQGGSGKSRLALEIAHAQRSRFADGVWFVLLAGVDSADSVIAAIADALNMRFVGEKPLPLQLYERLRDKHLLLVIDNLEHLPDQVADIIADLIQATVRLVVIATSRRRLQLRIETLMPLEGLPVPTADAAEPHTFAAVELFVDQMQRLNPFAQPDLQQVGQICTLVAGLPLGIELAANQTDRLSLDAISDGLQSTLAAANTALRDVPERQRSLRAVFESSWVLLTTEQQNALSQLAIFRGAFRFNDVQAILSRVDRAMMRSLVQHSLVQVAEGHYLLHEVVREFSAEKAPPSDIANRHSQYYLNIAIDLLPQWETVQFAAALDRSRANWDNLNAAWQHAVQTNTLTATMITAVRALYYYRGLYHDGAALFAAAHAQSADPRICGWLLAAQAHFLSHQIDAATALSLLDQSLAIAHTHVDIALKIDAQLTQQVAHGNQSRYADCIALAAPIIAEADAMGQPLSVARAKFHAGYAKIRSGDVVAGRDMLLSARDICEREGNVLYQIMAARHLGMAQLFLGDLDSAENSLIAARDLAKRRQDREREMFVYSILGPVYLQKGDLSRATELFREQLAFAQLVGREADIALNQANLGNTLMELGRYEEAVEHISAALPIMERVGDRANVSTAQCVLASTYHARGDFESAAEWMKRAIALNAEIGARLNETGTRAVLGKIYLEMDRPKLAQHQFHESHRLAVEIGDPTRVRIAQIGMAQTALALGNLATAREQINDVMSDDRWQSAYNPAERAFDIYHVLAALNDARASRKLQQAHDLLQEQADCISDQGYRHSFLHHVPLHRAILNAYAKSADAIGDQSDRID